MYKIISQSMWKTGHVTCFPENRPLEAENRSHDLFSHTLGNGFMHFPKIKCCEKTKMDNAQNGYCSVEKTGKIKKRLLTL